MDPAEREALEQGRPEVKGLAETSFQMLKAELQREDPNFAYVGLTKVVGGQGADMCTEWARRGVPAPRRAGVVSRAERS